MGLYGEKQINFKLLNRVTFEFDNTALQYFTGIYDVFKKQDSCTESQCLEYCCFTKFLFIIVIDNLCIAKF